MTGIQCPWQSPDTEKDTETKKQRIPFNKWWKGIFLGLVCFSSAIDKALQKKKIQLTLQKRTSEPLLWVWNYGEQGAKTNTAIVFMELDGSFWKQESYVCLFTDVSSAPVTVPGSRCLRNSCWKNDWINKWSSQKRWHIINEMTYKGDNRGW